MSNLEKTLETQPERSLEGQKKALCDALCKCINSLEAEELFEFMDYVGEMVASEIRGYGKQLVLPESVFSCALCMKTFGNCEEDDDTDECLRRFKAYCNIEE